jgi:hypothetical protein
MHLLIPFASSPTEAGRHALSTLDLPHLTALLARLRPTVRHGSDEYSLNSPHEHALAAAWGWQGADGTLPFAAQAARDDGIEVGDRAWGLLTPVHWLLGRDHVTLIDPIELALDESESKGLFEAVRGLFDSEGFSLAWGAPLRWYAAHDTLGSLPCASLDRVIGRNVDRWLPHAQRARLLRRLQSEVQMLLYPHALNEAREAQGRLSVNSFWLSGCGRAQPRHGDDAVEVASELRAALLAEDWAAWAEAWRALDSGTLRDLLERCRRGELVALTLCGERLAQRYEPAPLSWMDRLTARWKAPSAQAALEAL